jgi:hypothetical protein
MKSSYLIFCILIISSSISKAQGIKLEYLRGGKAKYSDLILSHPGSIETVVKQKSTPEIDAQFRKYKSNRAGATILGFVGGVGVGYALGSVIAGDKFNIPLFAGGAAFVGTGIIFSTISAKALKKTTELFNQQLATPVSFSPIIGTKNGLTQVGVRIGF